MGLPFLYYFGEPLFLPLGHRRSLQRPTCNEAANKEKLAWCGREGRTEGSYGVFVAESASKHYIWKSGHIAVLSHPAREYLNGNGWRKKGSKGVWVSKSWQDSTKGRNLCAAGGSDEVMSTHIGLDGHKTASLEEFGLDEPALFFRTWDHIIWQKEGWGVGGAAGLRVQGLRRFASWLRGRFR
jgi:hypothetical protein